MPYYCTVPRCTSMAGKAKNVSFHQFPRDEDLAKLWNDILKRGKPYTKYSKVCSLHFKPEDYTVTSAGKNKGQWRTLRKDAIPSQNLPSDTPPPYTRKQSGAWAPSDAPALDPQVIMESQRDVVSNLMVPKNEPEGEPKSAEDLTRLHPPDLHNDSSLQLEKKSIQDLTNVNDTSPLQSEKKSTQDLTNVNDTSPLQSEKKSTQDLTNVNDASPLQPEKKSTQNLTNVNEASPLQLEKKSTQDLANVNDASPLQPENTSDERSPHSDKPVSASPLLKETSLPESTQDLSIHHSIDLEDALLFQSEKLRCYNITSDTSTSWPYVLNATSNRRITYNTNKEVEIILQQIKSEGNTEEINYTITHITIDLEEITNEDNDNQKHYSPSGTVGYKDISDSSQELELHTKRSSSESL